MGRCLFTVFSPYGQASSYTATFYVEGTNVSSSRGDVPFTGTFSYSGQYETGNASGTVVKVDISTNLWWFNGEDPQGGYDIHATLTETPVTTGTFKWDVTAGTSIVDLTNGAQNGDSITLTDTNTIDIRSTSHSYYSNDVTIALTIDGTHAYDKKITVKKPGAPQLLSGFPTDDPWNNGFLTTYRFKLVDQFGEQVPFNMPLNESFGAWEPDFLPYENWPEPQPKGVVTANREFADSNGVYGVAIPMPVKPLLTKRGSMRK